MAQRTSRDNILDKHLADGTILTSVELEGRLHSNGCSQPNARQILSRHAKKGAVWRSADLRLPRNQRLFASTTAYKIPSAHFFRAVSEKLATLNRRGISRLLQILSKQEVVSRCDAIRLLAIAPDGGDQRVYADELRALKEIGVRIIHANTGFESLINPHSNGSRSHDDLATEAISTTRKAAVYARFLIEQLRRWNIITWYIFKCANLSRHYITFNQQVFSGQGFSYLAPLQRRGDSKPIPTPTVLDVFGCECQIGHVESFLARIERISNRGKSQMPVLGIIAAPGFAKDAWNLGRRRGLMTLDLRQVCGDVALEAMALAEELVRHDDKGENDESLGKFTELLQELKTNPVVTVLRAIGFEVLSGFILRSQPCERVELGVNVPWEKTTRDVDLVGWQGDELWLVECKAAPRSRSLDEEDVKKFFTETVPAAKKFYRNNGASFERCRAEIWTTGAKGEKANSCLRSLSRPANDTWEIRNYDHVKKLIPNASGKSRLIQLLDAIAFEGSSDDKNHGIRNDSITQPHERRNNATCAEISTETAAPF